MEKDPRRKQAQLTFVIVGAGLVGVELMGELNAFTRNVAGLYKNVDPGQLRFEMIEAGPQIAPEFDEKLANYSAKVLAKRGVNIRTNTKVSRIYPDKIDLPNGESIDAQTIVVATGVAPARCYGRLRFPKIIKVAYRRMRRCACRGNQTSGRWGIVPRFRMLPENLIHRWRSTALREARKLAENIAATVCRPIAKPFVYNNKGTLAALGHFKGAGKVYGISIYGFVAWWVWRSYYVSQMPKWSRRLRIIIDWTVALFFHNDVVQLDSLRGNERPSTDNPEAPVPK